ncbi:aminotransferase [Thermolongibacillus altinsuensis]|uniref:Aminotransferase n=1 Tax=Thermolongibacillus altinsuensis TaxID=575256 RepID=A0A4R1QFN0_9BACL|nr:aminotransferase [Thermolongibacillus altinsuensis]TCL47307.1 aminotransferase [Thermolongibacillus altinsuensis]
MQKTKTYLSETVMNLKPSGIRRFFDLAASMEGVISLGVGEPDFVTSWSVREACILSLEQGYTSYTANAGLLELREEISRYLARNFQILYDPNSEIVVTVGASQALDLALRAIINPGDEVIVVEPSFVSYAPLVSLAGGVPVFVQTDGKQEFKLQPEQIEKTITSRTKAMILCSPNNPTGTVLNRRELEAISAIVQKYDLIVISDEIYAELAYDEPYTSFPSIPHMQERTILVNGFSKGFAMTGWRLGFIAAPKEFAQAILKIHQYAMMCAPTMAQYGAIEALKNGESDVEEMKKSYRRRRNYFVQSLNELGLSCHLPGGAFYAFPSIQSTGLTSEQFAERLLMEEKVAVVPGNVFGQSGEGYIRCSYASSMEQLQEAIRRMKRFLERL